MAVEIEGYDESVKRHTTCRSCGARLSYLKKDVHNHTTRDYDGGSDTSHTIQCAGCGDSVSVKAWY